MMKGYCFQVSNRYNQYIPSTTRSYPPAITARARARSIIMYPRSISDQKVLNSMYRLRLSHCPLPRIVDPAYPADRIPGSRIWIKLKIKLILLGGTI